MLCGVAADSQFAFYEFFAGGGMARLGLGARWRCLAANDLSSAKALSYARAFPGSHIIEGDVAGLTASDLPGDADLAWASFPCQDLSLAGPGAGLEGRRSGAFFGFLEVLRRLARSGRAPAVIALENVRGLAAARGGEDLARLVTALAEAGYACGAVELDARWFTAQSRPRIFIVGVRGTAPAGLLQAGPDPRFHTPAIARAAARAQTLAPGAWLWWRLPEPPARNVDLTVALDPGATWDAPERTRALLRLLSAKGAVELAAIQALGERRVGAGFRRMRVAGGVRVQRLELRFDGLAGCLRTPAGGSSRQVVVEVEGARVRSRLLRAREAARLMGLPDDYPLPARENEALALLGDGVAPPVVRWLAEHLLEPLSAARRQKRRV